MRKRLFHIVEKFADKIDNYLQKSADFDRNSIFRQMIENALSYYSRKIDILSKSLDKSHTWTQFRNESKSLNYEKFRYFYLMHRPRENICCAFIQGMVHFILIQKPVFGSC